jgi:endonuclease YncB( thermonuclease family)
MLLRHTPGPKRLALAAWTVLAFLIAGLSATTAPAAAAVCADHANQREAQLAKDTRDADNDGIYCEALPCPCLDASESSGNGGGGSSKPAPAPRPKPKPKPKPKPVFKPKPTTYEGVEIIATLTAQLVRAKMSDGSHITVRLLGISAPEELTEEDETECGSTEAKAALEVIRQRWTFVTLKTDRSVRRSDRNGALVAYVIPEDEPGTTYQQELLALGWAELRTYSEGSFKRTGRFSTAESEGSDLGAGIYAQCDGDFHLPE